MVMSVSVIRYTLSSKGTSITLNQQLGKNSRQEKKKRKKSNLIRCITEYHLGTFSLVST